MSNRDTLLAQITTNLSSFTNYKVSSELPFNSGDTPLFQKNKKTVYVGQQAQTVSEFIPTLSEDVMQTETVIEAFLTVDAKNQPSDIDSAITAILNARTSIPLAFDSEAEVETEIEADYITYTFTFTFVSI